MPYRTGLLILALPRQLTCLCLPSAFFCCYLCTYNVPRSIFTPPFPLYFTVLRLYCLFISHTYVGVILCLYHGSVVWSTLAPISDLCALSLSLFLPCIIRRSALYGISPSLSSFRCPRLSGGVLCVCVCVLLGLRCKGTPIIWNIQYKYTLFFENMQEKRKYLKINNIHCMNIQHKIKSKHKYTYLYISA